MKQQLSRGEAAEHRLDNHFADRFDITPATREQQRRGIDRIFQHRETGARYTIEYKTDWTAASTGNAFVETVSVDAQGKPGWAYASQADWLIYYVPGQHRIYIMSFTALREQLPRWVERCRNAPPIPNQGYNTLGILVPLREFARHCQKIEEL
jgi:hypothetical protein